MGFDNVNVNVSGPVQPTSTYKTKVLKGNHSFATQVTEPNMKYVIKHNFDLSGKSVTIPANCVLEFDGGSLSNGIVIGKKTVLKGKIAIENYDGVFINEKGIPLDERLDEFLVDVSIIEAYDSADFNDYNNESHYIANVNQSMTYWNGYFILLNVDSSNKPVAYICDSNFQPLYSTKLNITSHCNCCTVKDNTLYIGGSTTNPNYYFDLQTLLNNAINHNSTDPVGTFLNNIGVYSISWNERSKEFCVRVGRSYRIYDESWNELRTYSSIYDTFVPDYLIQGVYGQTDIIYDGYFVYTGIIMGARMTMFVIIDLDKNAIIHSKTLPSRAEIEGIVKVGKHIYCSCNCYGFFSIWGINSTIKSRLSCIQQGDVSYDVGKTTLYVNNTYNGESYGASVDNPFTRLSQALFAAYSQPVKYIALVNTGKPYWINQSINVNAYLYIYTTGGNNDNKADVILGFVAYSSFIRIENINLKAISTITLQGSNLQIYNSTIDGGTLSRVIGAFYSDCTIGLYNSTINCANNSAKMIFYQRCLLNFYIDYNSIISGATIFERGDDGICHFNVIMHKLNNTLPTVNATKMVRSDGTNAFEIFLNAFSNNNLSKGLLWFVNLPPAYSSEYKLVINAIITGNAGDDYGLSYNRGVFYFDKASSGAISNTMSYPILRNTSTNYNTIYPLNNTSLNLDTDLGKLLNILISYYFNQTIISSSDKFAYIKKGNNNVITIIDTDGSSYGRKSGTSDQRPNQLLNTDVGYIYFDTTLGKPIYWTGSSWVDATGATI